MKKTVQDINLIREKTQSRIAMRGHGSFDTGEVSHYKRQVLICGGTGCHSNKSSQILAEFNRQIKEKGLENDVLTVMTGCFGLCAAGPVVIVYPEGAFYSRMTVEDIIGEPLDIHHLYANKKERHDKIMDLMQLVGLNASIPKISTNT